MQFLNTETISFNPVTGELSINVLGLPMRAIISQEELRKSTWSVPSLASRLIEPLVLTVAASWSFVETNEEVAALTCQERALHEVMAQAFWWTTSHINSIDNVRLVHIQDLRRMSEANHAIEMSKRITLEMGA